MAADLAGILRLPVRHTHLVAPFIGIYDDALRAMWAIDQQPDARRTIAFLPE